MTKYINLVQDGIFPIMYDINGETIKKDLDTGFNCSLTPQGEGKLIGVPSLFIRTSGCNLRCFVLQPGRGIPMIYYPDGTRKKMTEVKEGDVILAYNEETKQIDETTVTELVKNTTTEWVQITVERLGTFNLTLEHPLLTTTGWITAGELREEDELLHISGTERNSYRMKKNNPMNNREISERMHSNQNYKNTRKSSGVTSAVVRKQKGIKNVFTLESRKKISDSKLGDKNPMKSLEVREKVQKTMSQNPKYSTKMSSVEIKTWDLIKELGLEPNIWFSGTGGYVVKDKTRRIVRVPDFKIHGEAKVIESAIQCYFRPDLAKYTEETIDFYERNGYEVLVLNGDLSKEEQSSQLLNFVHNGLKIQKIKRFSNVTCYKNSKPETRSYPTLNLHCFPHNNYLVSLNSTQSIISHNCTFSNKDGSLTNLCDTSYSSFNPENNRMKIEDILKIVEINLTHSKGRHIVITGGEPMCQQEALLELCRGLKELGCHITLETNGTIFNHKVAYYVDLYSISPKLSNSNPTEEKLRGITDFFVSDNLMEQHKNKRRNLTVIQKFIDSCWEFKFGDERGHRLTDEKDILEIQDEFLHDLEGWEPSDILLMPEGVTVNELNAKSHWLVEQCIRNGYRYCPRLHVELFGLKRSV